MLDAARNRADAARRRRSSVLGPVLFVSSALVNLWLLYYFHNRYWYPTDDGLYAHIAERLLSGEVLNADIQDVHPGYVHFVHALAFKLFGLDLVSLRYPLMAAAFAQACVGYALLSRRDHVIAACGAIAATSLGVVQFVDPTPNWYSLAISMMLAYWMMRLPVSHPYRLVGAGCLLGISTLFRQPSGVRDSHGRTGGCAARALRSTPGTPVVARANTRDDHAGCIAGLRGLQPKPTRRSAADFDLADCDPRLVPACTDGPTMRTSWASCGVSLQAEGRRFCRCSSIMSLTGRWGHGSPTRSSCPRVWRRCPSSVTDSSGSCRSPVFTRPSRFLMQPPSRTAFTGPPCRRCLR